jgi:hypothetical protein
VNVHTGNLDKYGQESINNLLGDQVGCTRFPGQDELMVSNSGSEHIGGCIVVFLLQLTNLIGLAVRKGSSAEHYRKSLMQIENETVGMYKNKAVRCKHLRAKREVRLQVKLNKLIYLWIVLDSGELKGCFYLNIDTFILFNLTKPRF